MCYSDANLIDYREVAGIAYAVDLLTKELCAEAMYCADEIVDAATVYHRGYPSFHLLRSLVGKRQAKDIPRTDAYLICKEGIPMCKYACLARAGSGNDAHPSFSSLHGLLLSRVKVHISKPRQWRRYPLSYR